MKLIIDIDEQHFELLQMAVMNGMGDNVQKIIAQGTPLPKGHGRMGDLDALRDEVGSWGMNDYEPSDFIDEIDRADTIIEADTESEE